MTDEEKLLKKISVIFQEAKETINDSKNFVIRYPLSLLRKTVIEYTLEADQPRLEDGLHVLSIGMGHPDPVGEPGVNGSNDSEVTKLWLKSIEEGRNECPFKDGDIIINGDKRYSDIGIFHSKGLSRFEIDAYAVLSGTFLRRYDSTFCFMWIHEDTRLANDEEKQRLFDALEKDGYRWNAKEKKIEKIPRWRAKEGETYYCLSATLHVLESVESFSTIDDVFHSLGNYFKTKEAAQKLVEIIKDDFKNSKTE